MSYLNRMERPYQIEHDPDCPADIGSVCDGECMWPEDDPDDLKDLRDDLARGA